MNAIASRSPASERIYSRFEPEQLNTLTDEELDALPFGVISLDSQGRIARYNIAEARFARLDRAQVLGRSFFKEIARCTATPDFQGRFDQLLLDPKPTSIRFEFTFAFRFGAQRVDIDMGTVPAAPDSPTAPRIYLCVNRRKFLPRQKDVPAAIEAPLIGELEPGAEAAGVARDAQGRRRLEVDLTMLEGLFGAVSRRDKAGATTMMRDWGLAWGRLAVADLETEALEREARSLGEMPMDAAMALVARHFQRQKLGRLSFDYEHAARGAIVLRVERSAFADVGPHMSCSVLEGLFAAILSHLASRVLVVRESCCRSKGAEHCLLVATSASRLAAVERAVRTPSLTPREIVLAVSEESRRDGR